MKILIFISTFPKPSETFIFNQIEGLISNGADVTILAWNQFETDVKNEIVEKYNLLSKTKFINLPPSKSKRLIKGASLFFKHIFLHPNLTLKAVNYKKYGKLVASLRPLFVLDYFSINRNYDVIINHYGPNGLVTSVFDEVQSGIKCTIFHGYDISKYLSETNDRIYTPLLQTNGYFFPVNEYFRNKLLHLGFPDENINIFHMGIDTEKFYKSEVRIPQSVIKLLTIGRLTDKKGIDLSIQLVAYLKKIGIFSELIIIGDGENKQHYSELIAEMNLTNHVYLVGWKDSTFVQQSMITADFIIQLSRTSKTGDQEGIPVVIMEAMAMGKIVISTRHSGIPEIITHNRNGYLVEEEDYKAAGDIITRIFNQGDIKKLSQLSNEAYLTVNKEFNYRTINSELYKFLEDKVEKNRA